MSAQSIEERVARVIAEVGGLQVDAVKPDATLAELGMDEYDVVDVDLALFVEFDVSLPESIEDATVAQICAAVRALTEAEA